TTTLPQCVGPKPEDNFEVACTRLTTTLNNRSEDIQFYLSIAV
ncbi:10926_t:CDS:1, partial [Ambispora leptoticha]